MWARAVFLLVLALGACSTDVIDNPYVGRTIATEAPTVRDADGGSYQLQQDEAGETEVRFFYYGRFCGAGQPEMFYPVGAQDERIAVLTASDPPVDDVDALCYAHDLCYEYVGHDSAECDNAFFASLTELIEDYQAEANRYADYERDWMGGCALLMQDIRAALKGKSPGRLMIGLVGDALVFAELADAVPDGTSTVASYSGRLGRATVTGEVARMVAEDASSYPAEGECRLYGEPAIDAGHFHEVTTIPQLEWMGRTPLAALETIDAQSNRLTELAFELRARNAELCGGAIGPEIGASFHSLSSYDRFRQEAAKQHFGVTDALTVKHVVKGSPADSVGLMPGDRVTQVNRSIPEARRGQSDVEAMQAALASALMDGPTALTVERGAEELVLVVSPVRSCAVAFELWDSQQIDAYADGQRVVVTSGMMQYAPYDPDLAFILGREMAHNALTHPQSLARAARRQATASALGEIAMHATFGVFLPAPLPERVLTAQEVRAIEAQADYLGLYFAARAGFNADGASSLLQRFEREQRFSAYIASMRGAGQTRMVLLRNAQAEIAQRREQGQELYPRLASIGG